MSSTANLDAITSNFFLDENKEREKEKDRNKDATRRAHSDFEKQIVVDALIKDSGMMLFSAWTDNFQWKQGSADVSIEMRVTEAKRI